MRWLVEGEDADTAKATSFTCDAASDRDANNAGRIRGMAVKRVRLLHSYVLSVAHRQTGEAESLRLEATSEDEARGVASLRGFVVESISIQQSDIGSIETKTLNYAGPVKKGGLFDGLFWAPPKGADAEDDAFLAEAWPDRFAGSVIRGIAYFAAIALVASGLDAACATNSPGATSESLTEHAARLRQEFAGGLRFIGGFLLFLAVRTFRR